MSRYISPFDFSPTISKLFDTYGDRVRFEIEESLPEAAKRTRKYVKSISNVDEDGPHPGRYRDGWSYTTDERKVGIMNVVVHNKRDYQLTHLLENGHWNVRANSFTRAFPHIGKAQEFGGKELEKLVKERIESI